MKPTGQRHIWLCVTRTCNLACTYCYQGSHVHVPDRLTKHMSVEVAQKAIDWSHEWAQGPLTVCYYGGEPLLRFELLKLIPEWREARKQRGLPSLAVSVTTNGTLLTPEVRSFMDKNGVGMLLSLDGPKRFHDKSRPYHSGVKSSWDQIDPLSVLKWRPRLEIAWQLDPRNFDPASGAEQITPDVVREMMEMGFRNINFNVNWLDRWSEVARWNVQWLFKSLTLWMLERQAAMERNDPKAHEIGLGCNWFGKLRKALETDVKMVQPCGTGLMMVGVSPEGWLYPSQEMVYTVEKPDRAPGTSEFYRIGDLNKTPVLDVVRLAEVSTIRTEQMRPPAPFKCETCVAKSASIGGCHCRYVGQDGMDPSNRFDVTPGYCESTVAIHAGMLMGASVARWIRPQGWSGKPYTGSMEGFGAYKGGGPTPAAKPLPAASQGPSPAGLELAAVPGNGKTQPARVEGVEALVRKVIREELSRSPLVRIEEV